MARVRSYKRVSIQGLEETLARLARIGKQTSDAELARLRRGAREMERLAKMYAPVDEGYLEEAIVTKETRVETLNRRYEILVGVDPDRLGPGYTDYGYRYDIAMHEGFVNGEPYQLGPKSLAKQAALGVRVGPKYLKRAFDEVMPQLEADMRAIAKREALK